MDNETKTIRVKRQNTGWYDVQTSNGRVFEVNYNQEIKEWEIVEYDKVIDIWPTKKQALIAIQTWERE